MCGIVGLLVKNQKMRAQIGELMMPMLIGMTERAHALGGNLEVSARRQGGTAVTLKLPCVDFAR